MPSVAASLKLGGPVYVVIEYPFALHVISDRNGLTWPVQEE